mgnify:CR=1 FL=1
MLFVITFHCWFLFDAWLASKKFENLMLVAPLAIVAFVVGGIILVGAIKSLNLSWLQGFRGIMRILIKACIPILVSWFIFLIWFLPATLFDFLLRGIFYTLLTLVYYYYINNDFQQLILKLSKKIRRKKELFT